MKQVSMRFVCNATPKPWSRLALLLMLMVMPVSKADAQAQPAQAGCALARDAMNDEALACDQVVTSMLGLDRKLITVLPTPVRDGMVLVHNMQDRTSTMLAGTYFTPTQGLGVEEAIAQNPNNLQIFDVWRAPDVLARLQDLWEEQLILYARHLERTQTIQRENGVWIGAGCPLQSCAWASGLMLIKRENGQVYTALTQEGSGEARPALETWPESLKRIHQNWLEGQYREANQ